MTSETWYSTRRCVPGLIRPVLPVAFISCWMLSTLQLPDLAHAGDEPRAEDDRAKDEQAEEAREQLLEQARQRVQATKVYKLDEGARIPVQPLAEPVFRYCDHPRSILEGTLWAWGTEGRPLAMEKTELYRWRKDTWLHCFASLSEDLLEAEWPDGHRWSAKKRGLELYPLPDGPTPAESPLARLLQMKNLTRRFASTVSNPPTWQAEQRLLPRPVHRYSDPDSGLQDGAIFAFSTNGTNPDLLLLVELHGERFSDSVWKFGLGRMTNGGLNVRLDGKEVWSVPLVWPEKIFDTWLYFFESRPTVREKDQAR